MCVGKINHQRIQTTLLYIQLFLYPCTIFGVKKLRLRCKEASIVTLISFIQTMREIRTSNCPSRGLDTTLDTTERYERPSLRGGLRLRRAVHEVVDLIEGCSHPNMKAELEYNPTNKRSIRAANLPRMRGI